MISLNSKNFSQIASEVLGKKVHMKSDCELFPNGETVMTMITTNGKTIYIGSNMKNLRYEKA